MSAPRATFLTSAAVTKTADADYPPEVSDWLIPHEAIRREMSRAMHGLDHMDPVTHPWKAFGFRLWYQSFFDPSVHAHHDTEEHIVGPYYAKLGDKPVFGETKNHKELLDQMEDIRKQAVALAEAATVLLRPTAVTEDDQAAVRKGHAKLRNTWALFKEWMEIHLAEEEKAWPLIYKKHGADHQARVLKLILKEDMGQPGFDKFVGSILDSVGAYDDYLGLPKTPSCGKHFEPWCSRSFADGFLSSVPWVPRTLIFPGYYKKYVTTWKALVDSLGGSENVTGVTPKGFPPANACCTVM